MKKYLIPQTQVCVCVPQMALLGLSMKNGERPKEDVQLVPGRLL